MKIFKWTKRILGLIIILITILVIAGFLWAWHLKQELPKNLQYEDLQLGSPLKIYDKNHELLIEIGSQKRVIVELNDIPQQLKDAVIAIEDQKFYSHPGYDVAGIARSAWVLATKWRKEQGGSTITQQVARNYFLTPEKTFSRKMKEILLAVELEKTLGKDKILYLYLNKIYLGSNAFGVESAARTYFGKKVSELSLAESALIAGLPQAPSVANPFASLKRATDRRNLVLKAMLTQNKITQAEYDFALKEEVKLVSKEKDNKNNSNRSYITELARKIAEKKYGTEIYTSGYKIYTTIDSKAQTNAEKAIEKQLIEYNRRHEWYGVQVFAWQTDNTEAVRLTASKPKTQTNKNTIEVANKPLTKAEIQEFLQKQLSFYYLEPVVIVQNNNQEAKAINVEGKSIILDKTSIDWVTKEEKREDADTGEEYLYKEEVNVVETLPIGGMVYVTKEANGYLLAQIPKVNAGFVALDSQTGAITSMVGGFSFNLSEFNRATHSAVSVGSLIKPFVYSAALENGYTLGTSVNDAPIAIRLAEDQIWKPKNDSNSYSGLITIRRALAQSKNSIAVRLGSHIGTKNIADYLLHFGLPKKRINAIPSLVLGSVNFTPLELARAYAVFANGGFLVEPYIIDHITDRDGNVIYEEKPAVACTKNCDDIQSIYDKKYEIVTNDDDAVIIKDKEFTADEVNEDNGSIEQIKEDTEVLNIEKNNTEEAAEIEQVYAPRVLDAQTAFLMHSALQSSIYSNVFLGGTDNYVGTSIRARSLGRRDIGGKTGTTNESQRVWFAGYGANYVSVVYVGFDNNRPLGNKEYGSNNALPIWISYMRGLLKNVPTYKYPLPEQIIQVRIDPKTGLRVHHGGYLEYFINGTHPKIYKTEKTNTTKQEDYEDLF